jgi:hypothetical protein
MSAQFENLLFTLVSLMVLFSVLQLLLDATSDLLRDRTRRYESRARRFIAMSDSIVKNERSILRIYARLSRPSSAFHRRYLYSRLRFLIVQTELMRRDLPPDLPSVMVPPEQVPLVAP